jgi:phenylalanyl-tRNA synthetase beta chain
MKFTLNWLKEYIDLDLPVDVVADKLTMLGLEVDNVDELYQELEVIKVARIIDVRPHPDADRLSLCDVTVGEETFQVVCGAPNARPELLTAIALPGSIMPGGFKVKKAAIRGQESSGMLCSEKDLGISEDHSGIMELPDTSSPGQSLPEAISLRDTLIEVDLTPNRPDCTSVIGIAREIAGFTGQKMNLPVKNDLPKLNGEGVPFSVEVLDPEDCPRYAARLLKNVSIGPSPWWLRKRLLSIGLRPINNVVDITNLVMLEYGQPLHAFDFDRLGGAKIIVRRARGGEDIVTLDGEKENLTRKCFLSVMLKSLWQLPESWVERIPKLWIPQRISCLKAPVSILSVSGVQPGILIWAPRPHIGLSEVLILSLRPGPWKGQCNSWLR